MKARRRAVVTASPDFPLYYHTFVYEEMQALQWMGFEVNVFCWGMKPQDRNPAFEDLWRNRVILPTNGLLFLEDFAYFSRTRPDRVALFFELVSKETGLSKEILSRDWDVLQGFSFARHVEAVGTDYLHSYFFYPQSFMAMMAAFLLDIPRGITAYADHMLSDYRLKCVRLHLELADVVVATSKRIKDELSAIGSGQYDSKILIKPNGVDVVRFPFVKRVAHLSAGTEPELVSVSRIDPKKGLVYLAEAIRILGDRGLSVRLNFIGSVDPFSRTSTEYAEELTTKIRELGITDRFVMHGVKKQPEVFSLLSRSCMFVAPYVELDSGDKDGVPTAMLEAMSTGLPIVATDAGSILEVVRDGEEAICVPQRDPVRLADAIERLIRDSALRMRLGKSGRRRVASEFSTQGTEQLLHERIESILQRRESNNGSRGMNKKIEPIQGLVSIIVVNMNGQSLLEKFLPSLAAQTYRNIEVFMVDNGSTDGSVAWVMNNHPRITVIELNCNRGFSVANNIAIKRCHGEFILTLNTDMLLEPEFVERLVEGLASDPKAGWAAPKLFKLTEKFQKEVNYDCFGHYMTKDRFAHGVDPSVSYDPEAYKSRRYVFGASGCGALYRRVMLEDVTLDGQYYDEDFFAYFEDVDLDWRAQIRGWKCLFVPEAVGYHIRGGSGLKRRNPSIEACMFSNRFFMMMKNNSLAHLREDLRPILKQSMNVAGDYLKENPRAFWLGLLRLVKFTPKMLWKRRRVQRSKRATDDYLQSLFKDVPCQLRRFVKPTVFVLRIVKRSQRLARSLAFRIAFPLAKFMESVLVTYARVSGMKYTEPRRTQGTDKRRIALIMPILPDLSHTFLYREAYELAKLFDLRVVTIFKGDTMFHTLETLELAKNNVYYPPMNVNGARFYFSFVRRCLRSPRKTANLLLLYKDELARRKERFITINAVRDSCHPLFGFTLADILERARISHIHANCSNISTNHTMVAAHLLDKSFSFTGYVDFDFDYSFKMLKEKMRLGDFMAVETHFCKARMVGYVGEEYRDKIYIIRIGLDLSSLRVSRKQSQDGVLRLITIGRFVEKKGLKHLIDACARLRQTIPDFRLYMIGDGPLRGALEEQTRNLHLEDRIQFTGPLQNDRVFEYLTEDSILVMPCVYAADGERDGIPTVIIEAMAMGINVISTRVSGIPELIEDGVNGLLVEPGDDAALAEAIIRLHTNQELADRLKQAVGSKLRAMFDVKANAAQLAVLLESSIDK